MCVAPDIGRFTWRGMERYVFGTLASKSLLELHGMLDHRNYLDL